MAFLPIATALYGAYNAYQSNKDAKAAAAKASQAPATVDINALNQQATQQALANAAASNKLEQQYNPYINQLRQTAASGLSQYLTPSANSNALTNLYMQSAQGANTAAPASTLFTNAADVAQKQLALGGSLDQETQNQIMRAGLARGGTLTGPGGGLGMGRDIAARDLGLTSLQLQNERMQNAANIGSTQQQFNLAQAQTRLQQLLGAGGAASGLEQQQYGRNLGLAGFTQGISQPEVGLSPSSIANLSVGNTNILNTAQQNAAAIKAQQAASQAALGGNLIGMGLGAYSNLYRPISTGINSYGGVGNTNYAPGY